MAIEIERKFLVLDDSWRKHAAHGVYYRQGYLTDAAQCSIRVRVDSKQGYLNIKSATLGVKRTEFEYPVPLPDANEMLDRFCTGALIEKRRYHIRHGRHLWEVDVFEGDNAGLVVAEIELLSEDELFELPPWAGKEVSNESRYYNVCLAKHPFKDWADDQK